MGESQINPGTWRVWLTAIRPFALPASTMPVLFGSLAAVAAGNAVFNFPLFIVALLTMVLLHSGANMLNDVNDFRKGLDKVPTPVSGAVVRGWLSARQVLAGAIVLIVIGCLLGLFLVYRVGPVLFWIGVLGVFIGVIYTAGPIALKYHGLGDLAVFLDFGILGALGAWVVQTGRPSSLPMIWAIPMSLLVVAILHANNWRDISGDTSRDIRTVASCLGDRGSLIYYGLLIFSPFVFVTGLVLLHMIRPHSVGGMPAPFLAVWLSFPMALALWRKAMRRREPARPLDFVALDGATAQFNLVFGLLCSLAVIIHLALSRYTG